MSSKAYYKNRVYMTIDMIKKDGFGSQFFWVLLTYATAKHFSNWCDYIHTPVISGRHFSGPNLFTNPKYISEANIEKLINNTWIKFKNNPRNMHNMVIQANRQLNKAVQFDNFFNLSKDEIKYTDINVSGMKHVVRSRVYPKIFKKLYRDKDKRDVCMVNTLYCETGLEMFKKREFITKLHQKINLVHPIKTYDKVNIAMHIRRGDVKNPQLYDKNSKRQNFLKTLYTSDEHYIKILNVIDKYFSDMVIVNIFSLEEDFDKAAYQKYNFVKLNLTKSNDYNGKDIADIQDMIYSDVLIASKSSYCKIASIYHIGYQFYNLDGSNVNIPIIKDSTKMFDYSTLSDLDFANILIQVLDNRRIKPK